MSFPHPGDIAQPMSPALAGGFFTTESPEKPKKLGSTSELHTKVLSNMKSRVNRDVLGSRFEEPRTCNHLLNRSTKKKTVCISKEVESFSSFNDKTEFSSVQFSCSVMSDSL